MGKDYNDIQGLPDINEVETENDINNLIQEEKEYSNEQLQTYIQQIPLLNQKQKEVFDNILFSVNNRSNQNLYFLDGPGGSGKSFLYNTILGKLRSDGKICFAVASSGIAAELIFGGRTAHSTFKIPTEGLKELINRNSLRIFVYDYSEFKVRIIDKRYRFNYLG